MQHRLDSPVDDRSAWRGADFTGDDSWAHQLTRIELDELDAALESVTEAGLAPLELQTPNLK